VILLDSTEIIAAVQRSLELHVLPELRDDFARVQVQAALKALAEVADRLDNGDPCERSNRILEGGVRGLAEEIRSGSPAFAESLDAALAAGEEGGAPRERARQLAEDLWSLVAAGDDPGAGRLMTLLREEALRMGAEDREWMCGEAIASLT